METTGWVGVASAGGANNHGEVVDGVVDEVGCLRGARRKATGCDGYRTTAVRSCRRRVRLGEGQR